MLRPHHREHAQLRQIRLAPENLDDLLILIVRQIMLRDEVFGNSRCCHVHKSFLHITLTTFVDRTINRPKFLAMLRVRDWSKTFLLPPYSA